MSTWVLTCCARNRLDELKTMLATLNHPAANTVIITTQPDTVQPDDVDATVLLFSEPGMLFSSWHNLGLDYIASQEQGEYEVLMIGSSILGNPSLIPVLRYNLREHHLSMIGPDVHNSTGLSIRTEDDVRTVHNRVLGACMMAAGELGVRFNERYRWWYADDQYETEHCLRSPVGLLGGTGVILTHPDGHYLNAEQQQWADEDHARYIKDYGTPPW